MTYHFTQGISMHATGFGNAVKASVMAPEPIASEYDGKVVGFDPHPYIAASGYISGGSEYPEQDVPSCIGSLVLSANGSTETVYERDYGERPSVYGMAGERYDFVFEVGYGSTAACSWTLPRVVFAYIDVERNGIVTRMENVACLQLSESYATARLWGQTDSWGSEGERFLSIPWQETR